MSKGRYTKRQWVVIAICLLAIGVLPLALVTTLGWRGAEHAHHTCTLLDAERVLLSEGTDFVFMVPEPGTYWVEVTLSPHCTSTATVHIAPLRTALRPDPVYEPDEAEHTLPLQADEPVLRGLDFAEVGPYILRVEPIPMAMGTEGTPTAARVRICPLGG